MIYVIGSCRIDTNTYEVHRDGVPVSVEPQVFDLLCFLVESRDRIVTRDEIVERVWNGRIVSDAAISGRIKAARRAIGDDGKTQSMIRTIHRRGIRFVGDVKFNDAEQDKPDTASEPVVARATSAGLPDTGSDRTLPGLPRPIDERDSAAGIDLSLPKRPSLVVLPFHVLSGDETGQMIADGLSLDIMTGLARTRWLFVIARGTAFKFRGPSQDAYDIAQRLGVRYVLQGTIQYRGNRLRIHAALIDAVDARAVWADHLDRTVDDIFLIQDELAGVVVRSVEGEIEQSERQRALLVPASSLDAWSAYHRGTWHMYQFTPQHYEEAERLFKIAASLDPSASRVFAGLSFVHWQRAFLEIDADRPGRIDQAIEHAQHALMLDPRDPLGHWALGRALLLRQDFDFAIEEMEQAVVLNPNFAVGQYSASFGRLFVGDYAASEQSVRLARRLSPYDLMSFAMISLQAINATILGRLDEGAELADRAVRQANAHHHILAIAAFCNGAAGRDDTARQYLGRLNRLHPGYCIRDYFRAFPYRDGTLRRRVSETLRRLGLDE